jgi:hypothetical protein
MICPTPDRTTNTPTTKLTIRLHPNQQAVHKMGRHGVYKASEKSIALFVIEGGSGWSEGRRRGIEEMTSLRTKKIVGA